MPAEETVIKVIGSALELGGESAYRRYGWMGCLGLMLLTAAVVAGIIYWAA